jgi:hypothetical protein
LADAHSKYLRAAPEFAVSGRALGATTYDGTENAGQVVSQSNNIPEVIICDYGHYKTIDEAHSVICFVLSAHQHILSIFRQFLLAKLRIFLSYFFTQVATRATESKRAEKKLVSGPTKTELLITINMS